MKFGSTAKILAECKLKCYRISECAALWPGVNGDCIRAGTLMSSQLSQSRDPDSLAVEFAATLLKFCMTIW